MVPFRLHAKFFVLVVGSLAVFLGILSYIVIQREARMLTKKASEKQLVLAQAVFGDLKESMIEGVPRSTLRLMNSLRGSYGLERLEVLRRDGTHAFGINGGRLNVPYLDQAFETGKEIDFQERSTLPLHTRLFPLKNENVCRRCHGRDGNVLGVILISFSREDTIEEHVKNKREITLLFLVILLAIGGMLYAVIRKVVLNPIATLHRGAEAIGKGDLSHRIEVPTRDEFSDVANAFNQMAGRLSETYSGLEDAVNARTKELDESFRLIWGIITSMPGGVMLLDMAGRVKLINQYAAHMLRCRQTDVIGQELATVVPETETFVTASFEKADSGPYQETELSLADGTAVPLGFSSTYFRGAMGGYEGVIIVFQDVTELKTLQTELLNKERFAAMGRVVAGVAHEVRNPLFAISSIGQIFERELTNPAHQELVRALLSESRRLNQLVEDLLIYGRPKKLMLEQTDLRRLWSEVLALERDELKSKAVRVNDDYGIHLPLVSLDAHQIRQVFLNLLRNALDATPPGGEITIRLLLMDRYVVLQVRDTGAGIPAENRDKVFELFFTTKPKGTGLGLAICKKIVEDHGGDIAIESAEGAGTTVTLRLPYRRTAQ